MSFNNDHNSKVTLYTCIHNIYVVRIFTSLSWALYIKAHIAYNSRSEQWWPTGRQSIHDFHYQGEFQHNRNYIKASVYDGDFDMRLSWVFLVWLHYRNISSPTRNVNTHTHIHTTNYLIVQGICKSWTLDWTLGWINDWTGLHGLIKIAEQMPPKLQRVVSSSVSSCFLACWRNA